MSAMDTQTVTSATLAEGRKDLGITTSALPHGFPQFISGKNAFVGADFVGSKEFIFQLSLEDITEINQAHSAFKDLALDGTAINKKNFVLPTLGEKLAELSKEVHKGRGFVVIRGLAAANFRSGDLTVIYMGLASHIADTVGRQDGSGNALVHIKADKNAATHHRHSTDPISFHTEEVGDVVAWLTRNAAAEGGRCIISSGATIYNVLAATRPDLVRILAAGNFPFALPRYLCRPVLFNDDGLVRFNFGRAALLGSASNPRKAHLPTLSTQQLEALDAIETIARATEFSFNTQAGDLHFINNMTVLHRREGFTNTAGQERHLVRMLLTDSVYGSHIPVLKKEWTDAFNEEADRTFHIDPMPSGYFPLRKYPN